MTISSPATAGKEIPAGRNSAPSAAGAMIAPARAVSNDYAVVTTNRDTANSPRGVVTW